MTPVVLIPYRPNPSRDTLLRYVLARWRALFPEWMVVTSPDGGSPGEPFNHARAVNRAAAIAGISADVLIIADADIAISPMRVQAGVDLLAEGAPWVLPYDEFVQVNERATEWILSQDPSLIPLQPLPAAQARWRDVDHGIRSVCGLVIHRTDDYLSALGGMDERFHGWGWQDTAHAAAADTILGPVVRVPGQCLHLYHDLDPRRKVHPHARANRELCARYEAARGDRDAMLALVAERP